MKTSTSRIAHRFLALGGRLMIDPAGRLTFGLDADTLFSLALTARERMRSLRVARANRMLCWHEPDDLTALIKEHGTPLSCGWLVWEGR